MIEKFNLLLSGNLRSETFENLFDFLTEHTVPEYFDSVTKSTDGNSIYCETGERTFIQFNIAGDNTYCYINYADNVIKSVVPYYSGMYFDKAYKCKNGIFLSMYHKTTSNHYAPFFALTKDNKGNTVAIITGNFNSYKDNVTALNPNSTSTDNAVAVNSTKTSCLTSLCPLVVSDDEAYTPNAFVLPYAQSRSQNIFEADGVKYLSNGIWCIRDE